jgi:hypothetical protein
LNLHIQACYGCLQVNLQDKESLKMNRDASSGNVCELYSVGSQLESR